MKNVIKEQLNKLYVGTLPVLTEGEKETQTDEEWIWVEGYKGTNKDMKCLGYQYELNKQFDMPENEKIEACESGFHLCTKLTDVYSYYSIGEGNRFFKVRALVRKNDYEIMIRSKSMYMFSLYGHNDSKLAAKSIEFIEELTPDEILKGYITDEWTEEDKQDALQYGTEYVRDKHKVAKIEKDKLTLIELGYSAPFASWLISHNKYDKAFAVGSQSDLSMDMKVLAIMNL